MGRRLIFIAARRTTLTSDTLEARPTLAGAPARDENKKRMKCFKLVESLPHMLREMKERTKTVSSC